MTSIERGMTVRRRSTGKIHIVEKEYGRMFLLSDSTSPAAESDIDVVPSAGEGWRLLEGTDFIAEGDEGRGCVAWNRFGYGWFGDSVQTVTEKSSFTHVRRRIPAPFCISDKGTGVYETRDGQQEPIEGKSFTGNVEHPWRGAGRDGDYKLYRDDGQRCSGRESPDDLVRYIGPLPAPETTPKFKVGDKVRTIDGYGRERWCVVTVVAGGGHADYMVEDGGWSAWRSPSALEAENTWTSTCELRWNKCTRHDTGSVAVGNGTGCLLYRIEQRWTSGERSEWRPVPVEAAT